MITYVLLHVNRLITRDCWFSNFIPPTVYGFYEKVCDIVVQIETTTLKYVSDGLYPSIMVEKPGCKVRVLKYYSETKAHREAVLLAKEEAAKVVETVTSNFSLSYNLFYILFIYLFLSFILTYKTSPIMFYSTYINMRGLFSEGGKDSVLWSSVHCGRRGVRLLGCCRKNPDPQEHGDCGRPGQL